MKHLLLVLLLSVTAAHAVQPDVARLIEEGDALLPTDAPLAKRRFVDAKVAAAKISDWDGMLFLTDRFLKLKDDGEGKDCYLLALQYAQDLARYAKTKLNPGQSCAEAVSALGDVSLFFLLVATTPMGTDTFDQMRAMSEQASSQSDQYRIKGCP